MSRVERGDAIAPVDVGKPISPVEWKYPAGVKRHPLPPEATFMPKAKAAAMASTGAVSSELLELPQGWLTDDEARELAVLSRGLSVLEIGSFRGRSTIVMAREARIVYAVDHHRGSVEHQPGQPAHQADTAVIGSGGVGVDTLPEFMANLRAHGVERKVVPIIGDAGDVLPLIRGLSIDVVFVDGSHDRESVARDAMHAFRIGRKSVLFHDANYETVIAGITEAITAYGVDDFRWRLVRGVGSLAVYETT